LPQKEKAKIFQKTQFLFGKKKIRLSSFKEKLRYKGKTYLLTFSKGKNRMGNSKMENKILGSEILNTGKLKRIVNRSESKRSKRLISRQVKN